MKATHSFSIQTPKDLLAKLEREHERFTASSSFNSEDHKYQYDHAVNFSYTAWHLVDWIWRYLESNKLGPEKETGCESFDAFHKLVRAECPGLQICYELTNGTKHFRATKIESPKVVGTREIVYETDGITRPVVMPVVRPVIGPAVKKHHADLVVYLEGKSTKFVNVCDEVVEYWKKFFDGKSL